MKKLLAMLLVTLMLVTTLVSFTSCDEPTQEPDKTVPLVRINEATNMWEMSTDDGKTWVSMGAPATGDRGPKGDKGEKGASVANVQFDADGRLVITLTDGTVLDPIEIPQKEEHVHSFGQREMFFRGNTCANNVYYSVCAECKEMKWYMGIDECQPTGTYDHDNTHHWTHCIHCDSPMEYGEHTPDEDGKCTICGANGSIDMKGYVYKAFVRHNSGNVAFRTEDFWYDEATSGQDALSYAVIQRNKQIEADYNCQIQQVLSTMTSQFEEMREFFSGDVKYELAILVAADAASCAAAGFLTDLKSEQYLNLENEAFDQNSIDQLSLGNNLYFLSGDMNISTMDLAVATIFNKNFFEESAEGIVEQLGDDKYGDVYQMVEDGQWTIDNMLKIAKCVDNDANNNDGTPSYDKGDTIGYYQYQASGLYYYYGAGMRITTKGTNGYPSFTINSSEAEEFYDYLFDNLNINLNTNIPSGASGERSKNFQSGQVLFTDYLLWDVRRVLYSASIDFAYGILPIPTYEENAEYHSLVYMSNNCAHLWTIPYKRSNNEYAARMMEIMANYSAAEDSTMDAYYVKTMYMEVARDDGSRASLDIIRGSRVYDLATIYCDSGWGRFTQMLSNIDNAAVREYDMYTSDSAMLDAQNDLQETIDQFASYGG